MNRTLATAVGEVAPHVRGMIVVAQPRDDIPAGVRLAVRRNHIGLMTNEDALALIVEVREGYPMKELARRVEVLFEPGAFGIDVDEDDEEWSDA